MRGTPRLFTGFVDGVNQRDAPYLLGDTEARDARNVQGTVRGAIRKRDGALGFSTPANALTSLFAAQSPTFLVGAGSTKLFSISPAAAVVDITGALGLTSGALFDFIQAPASGGQGPVYGMNGSQAVQWTGAGNAAAWTAATGTLPIGKYVLYAGLRVWVAGMASYGSVSDPGSTVVASELGDPRNWPAANVYQFDPNDGETITGLGRVGPYVLVFKPSKCWVIYDTDIGANRPLAEGIGCVANRSIRESDQGTFFLSRDQGPFVTNGSSVDRLNDKIQPTFDALVQNNRQLATGCIFGGHYYLAISTTGVANDLLLDYDMRLKSWWIHTLPVSDMDVWEPASSIPQLHASVAGVARTDQLFVSGRTQDAGNTNFTYYWRGAHHVFGKPFLRKRCRELHFDGKGVIEVSIAKDFSRSFVNTGEGDFTGVDGLFGVGDGSLFGVSDGGIYGGAQDVQEAVFPSLGVARSWSIEFGGNTDDEMEVESYTMMMDERRD
jgi:hypothetical protein